MEKILYRSTNRSSKEVEFKEAVLKGQAPDYGLYMPTFIPEIKRDEIESYSLKEYYEIAFSVLIKFLKNEIPEDILMGIVKKAYNFPVPLQKIKEGLYILYLDRGPTA
ncbi:MAG: threonine synthase, partial [bacterium]|nr:threonine synthase [bacterium]MDW8163367.1 threonine synthase [Candidatus Omnitrophota bacterium]